MMLSAAAGFIYQSEKYSRENAGQSLKKYTLLKRGEVAYNHGASKLRQFGCCFELTIPEARIPYVYHTFKISDENCYTPYIAQLLNNPLIDRQLKRLVSSSVRMDGLLNISYDEYMTVDLHLPERAEQEKIEHFLSLLNERIKKQQRLVEALKSYKRGVIERIFSDDNCRTWKRIKLSEILSERKEYCEKDGTFVHATLSKDGVSEKTDRYDRDFLVTTEEKKYKVTHKNDLCYNPANLKFGVICVNDFGDAIFSPIYITFEICPSVEPHFLGMQVMRWNFINRALRFQQGTVYERTAVSPEDLLSMSIVLPPMEIQRKVSNAVQVLSTKISIAECIGERMSKLKSALLSQLFI